MEYDNLLESITSAKQIDSSVVMLYFALEIDEAKVIRDLLILEI